MKLAKQDIKAALEGEWILEGPAETFAGVGADTRKPLTGQVFFALKGRRFDGHDFLPEALQKGAALLIASDAQKIQALLPFAAGSAAGSPQNRSSQNRNPQSCSSQSGGSAGRRSPSRNKRRAAPDNVPAGLLLVKDSLAALQSLAAFWRQKLRLKLIAVTGSVGKTSVKEFTKALLPSKTGASPGNFNNDFGAPFSLLSLKEPGRFFVQEIGASAKGEISRLTRLCDPFAVAVTTIGPAHLDGFGDMQTLASEKQQIYERAPRAFQVFNEDNPWTAQMLQERKKAAGKPEKILAFSGKNRRADVFLSIAEESGAARMKVKGLIGGREGAEEICFSGKAALQNMMCAAALALAAGVRPENIWRRLPELRLPAGRQNRIEWKERGVLILFDAYNSNPLSMEAFLEQCGKERAAPVPSALATFPDGPNLEGASGGGRRHGETAGRGSSGGGRRLFLILGDMLELGAEAAWRHSRLGADPVVQSADFVWHIGRHGDIVKAALCGKGSAFKGRFVQSLQYEAGLLPERDLRAGDIAGIKASRGFRLERALFDLTGRSMVF